MTTDAAPFSGLTHDQLAGLTVYGEARGERMSGKFAVAFVIVNRSLLWKQTITGVCLAPNQFECFNPMNVNRPLLIDIAQDFNGHCAKDEALKKCYLAAQGAINKCATSNVGNATFYKTITCKSPWFDKQIARGNMIKVATVGNHDFFEEARFRAAQSSLQKTER